jgi:Reverse transcriptase (RNA-dependent DNA polymerase).
MHSEDDELVLMVVVYVEDDCTVCGTNEEMIKWWKEKRKTRFIISDLGPIKKHIGVWYEEREDEEGRNYELSMNNYCEDLIKRTEEELCGTIRKAKTPAYPGKVLKKRRDNEPMVAVEECCSLIGTALYIMAKKVSPVSTNAVRELSQYLAEPSAEDHWRALMRLIGFFKQKPQVMKIRATKSLRSVG